MALAGIGVDIIEIARMERVLERRPSFAERVFTADERAYCFATARPAQHFAGRFAAREAVLKALGTGFAEGIGLQDVWVSKNDAGRPVAHLEGRALEVARSQGVREMALSLSFTHELAVANAVAITDDVRPVQPEEKSAEKELATSFKEARSVLDELERVQDAAADTQTEAQATLPGMEAAAAGTTTPIDEATE